MESLSIRGARARGASTVELALLSLILAGCVSYSPSQLAALDTVDLCELEQMQRCASVGTNASGPFRVVLRDCLRPEQRPRRRRRRELTVF